MVSVRIRIKVRISVSALTPEIIDNRAWLFLRRGSLVEEF